MDIIYDGGIDLSLSATFDRLEGSEAILVIEETTKSIVVPASDTRDAIILVEDDFPMIISATSRLNEMFPNLFDFVVIDFAEIILKVKRI